MRPADASDIVIGLMALSRPQKLGIGAAAVGALVFLFRKQRSGVVIDTPALPVDQVKALIKSEAKKQGVDPRLALTFAELESNFRSNVVGERDWPFLRDSTGQTKWQRFVRDNPRYSANPFRGRQGLWVSYGLFQLLSAFELWRHDPNGDPRDLAVPEINVRLGVAKIKRLQERFGNDPLKIRLSYVGCGETGGRCPPGTILRVARKLAQRARTHGLDLGTDSEVVARAQALVMEFAS